MSLVQNHQVSILVVDTDDDSRRHIQEVLTSDGYGCRVADSAIAALREVDENAPSLLVCDVDLGEESGLDLYRQIKETIDCPVVFLSGSRLPETVQHARRAGGTYFLSKPFDPTVLLELVDKALWMPHLVRRHVDSAAHQLNQLRSGA